MKILIDKNIPYVEHFFADHLDQIQYFFDEDFEIENVKEDSVVVVRSTYKTHGKKIPKSIKFLCSASTGEDHIDKKELNKMKIPYAFSTGANAIAVREYIFSALALLLKEEKLNKATDRILIIGIGNIGEGIQNTLDYFDFNVESFDPFKKSSLDTLENLKDFKLISLHVPLTKHSKYPTKNLVNREFLRNLNDGSIIINTSRGGVLLEKDFMEFNNLNLISDVFINEPNIDCQFLERNLFGTPHIAGHSQLSRYQMTKMGYENVVNFLGIKNTNKKSMLENKNTELNKDVFKHDMEKFGFPVSLILDTYNPKLDHFECADFKKIRDNYNNRIGYSQVVIKGCDDETDRSALEVLGFEVQDS